MSATRDKSQKITFVYTNLHHLFKKGVDAAQSADLSQDLAKVDARELVLTAEQLKGVTSGKILKADAQFQALPILPAEKPQVREYRPVTLTGLRIADKLRREERTAPVAVPPPAPAAPLAPVVTQSIVRPVELYRARNEAQSVALKGLRDNLKSLNDLQSRLKVMLKEIEELVNE